MSQVCELTGKRPAYGNKVSHSNIKTRTRWMPNLKAKKIEIPELKLTYSLLLSARAFRTIDKAGGITAALMNAKDEVLSPRLLKVKRQIHRSRVKATGTAKVAATKHVAGEKAAAPAKVAAPAKAAKAPAKAKAAPAAKATKAKK